MNILSVSTANRLSRWDGKIEVFLCPWFTSDWMHVAMKLRIYDYYSFFLGFFLTDSKTSIVLVVWGIVSLQQVIPPYAPYGSFMCA